jgi:NCS1 family nucleobase:cation symporter-1
MDIEKHCIEFIPESERYGSARRLFTIWFSSNVQITTLVVGTLGIAAGLSLFWTSVGTTLGVLIGTVFMAAHSAQGPHLGIPQMIQSRAQFGVIGAMLPLCVIVLVYILFTAANAIVMRDAVKTLLPLGDNGAIWAFGIITLAISFVGYELIHRMGAYMTAISGAVFLTALVLILRHPLPTGVWEISTVQFRATAFMLVVTQGASWTLGFGPFVADYSRYLPSSVSIRETFWYTYIGNALGAALVMFVGALLAVTYASKTSDPGTAIAGLFGGYSKPALSFIVLGVLEINVLQVYSAYMSATAIFTGFSGAREITHKTKSLVMALVTIIATAIALATQYRFNDYFADILIAQIYFLVPWSSINLVDYYFVKHGDYSVKAMFDSKGIYGRFNLRTIAIYGFAVLVQVPFMDLSFYRGPVASAVGSDIAWIPALVVPGSLYYWFARSSRRTLVATKRRLPAH